MAARLDDLPGEAAARFPERDAVVLEGRRLSWAGLEAASNRVARSLLARGVAPGDRVALWLPKSLEAVAALWGILKAGVCYVPVDPGAPPARLAWIARDCGVAGLVTRSDRAREAGEALGAAPPLLRAVWYADDPAEPPPLAGIPAVAWREVAAEDPGRPAAPAASGEPAYILSTSGSTGEPKGVVHTHASALAFAGWAAATFAVTHEDRLANHAPFHFDLSTFDLFAAALAGAAVHPVPPRLLPFPAAVARSWCAERLTVWYATPSSLVLMLTRGGLAALDLSAVRVLLFAGEVFPVKYLRDLMRLAPRARFANLYGPTETNVCTWHEVRGVPADDRPLPIGRPSCGDEAHVLGEDLTPVAEGQAGELWVSGPTLMRGYWGDAERTGRALREIEPVPGRRVLAYRTGDLVRLRPDGELEFLGRRDHQVKTRGYRVELGEIESRILAHPAVDEAVVVAVPDEEITHRLKAVLVLRPGTRLDEADVKRHCAETLPRYMVPESVEFRASLPRTSSGKVDRRALVELPR